MKSNISCVSEMEKFISTLSFSRSIIDSLQTCVDPA